MEMRDSCNVKTIAKLLEQKKTEPFSTDFSEDPISFDVLFKHHTVFTPRTSISALLDNICHHCKHHKTCYSIINEPIALVL